MRRTARGRSTRFFWLGLCLAALLVATVGCGGEKRTYYWSSYQSDLRAGGFGQEKSKNFELTLQRIIDSSDKSGLKPPPGVLAEYGFFFFQRDEMRTAIIYFERESLMWPESAAFMERAIERATELQQQVSDS